MELYIKKNYLFFMKLYRSHDLGREFNRVAQVDLDFFIFLIYFIRFHPLTLNWLEIEFFLFFLFAFYIVISIS
jgi:hypothetical protein